MSIRNAYLTGSIDDPNNSVGAFMLQLLREHVLKMKEFSSRPVKLMLYQSNHQCIDVSCLACVRTVTATIWIQRDRLNRRFHYGLTDAHDFCVVGVTPWLIYDAFDVLNT